MRTLASVLIGFLVLTLFTGCVFKQGVVALQNIEARNEISPSVAKGIVFIRQVKDKRDFQDKPRRPYTPSVYNQSVHNLTAKEKDIYIGRKRNGYGKAFENIVLDGGQTVTGIIRNSVARAFIDNGFYILQDEININENVIIVDVDVIKFWTFLNMNFWRAILNTHIETSVKIKDKNITTYIDYKEFFAIAGTDNTYKIITNNALKIYEKKLTENIADELK